MNKSLLSKNYILTVVSATFFYISAFMLNTVVVRFITDNGHSSTLAGVVASAFTLASFATRPVWGWLCDKKGRKIIYLSGASLCTAAVTLLFVNAGIFMLTVSRVLLGIGYSALTTAGGTMVCDISPKEKLQQGIAIYGVTNVLSQAVAPVAALWLYKIDFIWVVVASAVGCAVVTFTVLFVKYNENDVIDTERQFSFCYKPSLPAAYTIIFFAMATSSVNSFIPLLAQQRLLTADSLFFVVSALFLLITRLLNKKLVSKFGNISLFYIGGIIYIASFAILSVAHRNIFLLVSASLYGTGAGFIHPVVNTAAVKDCSSADRGLATGTFMMSQDLGMAVGAFLWGTISNSAGFTAVYITVVILLLVMMYIFKKVLKSKLC